METKTFRLCLIGIAVAFCVAVGLLCIVRAQHAAGPRTNLELSDQRMM